MEKVKNLVINKKLMLEVCKFLLIGGVSTLIDFGITYLFQILFSYTAMPDMWIKIISTGIGFSISLVFNYIFNCVFVFKDSAHGKTAAGFIKFLIISLIGLGIHTLGMFIGYNLLNLNDWLVKIILTGIVLVFNFVFRKLFIFNEKNNEKEKYKNASSNVV